MSEQHAAPCQAPEDCELIRAIAHVHAGGLVVLPTDTVYGIGAAAGNAAAVAHLLEVKGRGRHMPPPVLISGPEQLDGVAARVPPTARALIRAFWPGALTLILDADPSLGWDLGETGATVALRMPNHPLTLALLRATGPMAVTSANPTGQPPATDAASGRAAFPRSVRGSRDDPTALGGRPTPGRRPRGGRAVNPGDPDGPDDFEDGAGILVLDGGPTPGPVPSTIVNLAGDHALAPVVVRQGALPHARLAAVVDPILTALGAPPLTGPGAVDRGAPKEAGA